MNDIYPATRDRFFSFIKVEHHNEDIYPFAVFLDHLGIQTLTAELAGKIGDAKLTELRTQIKRIVEAGADTNMYVFELKRDHQRNKNFGYHIVKVLSNSTDMEKKAVMIYTLNYPNILTRSHKSYNAEELGKLFCKRYPRSIAMTTIWPMGYVDRCAEQGKIRSKQTMSLLLHQVYSPYVHTCVVEVV